MHGCKESLGSGGGSDVSHGAEPKAEQLQPAGLGTLNKESRTMCTREGEKREILFIPSAPSPAVAPHTVSLDPAVFSTSAAGHCMNSVSLHQCGSLYKRSLAQIWCFAEASRTFQSQRARKHSC